jgi:hypothetical protein
MPVSKKRKKKRPHQRRHREPDFVMMRPLWEYRLIAEELAVEEPDLTADQALVILLHYALRFWDDSGRRIRTVFPVEMAEAAGTSVVEWLNYMEVLFEGGFMSWDDENEAHYRSIPNP